MDLMEFECIHCRKAFTGKWFDIGRAYERVHYSSPAALDEVEVADAEGIGVFCSSQCLEAGRGTVMLEQGVAIPAVRPGIGPIEECAKCRKPVDMSHWHLTFTDGCLEDEEASATVLEVAYLAVVCR